MLKWISSVKGVKPKKIPETSMVYTLEVLLFWRVMIYGKVNKLVAHFPNHKEQKSHSKNNLKVSNCDEL